MIVYFAIKYCIHLCIIIANYFFFHINIQIKFKANLEKKKQFESISFIIIKVFETIMMIPKYCILVINYMKNTYT